MRKAIKIPDIISSRTEYKRKFSVLEMYRAVIMIPAASAKMIRNKRKKLVDEKFIEKIHLAVTEVNGCAACSYAHSYMALKQGMSNDEINSFLSGDGKFIKEEESKAIAFAQHYADTRGYPKKEAYSSITREYGEEKAGIIVSAAQIMSVGNIYGIPFSAFQSRIKGKAYRESTILYELGMLFVGFIILPIALIHGVLRAALTSSNIRFTKG